MRGEAGDRSGGAALAIRAEGGAIASVGRGAWVDGIRATIATSR